MVRLGERKDGILYVLDMPSETRIADLEAAPFLPFVKIRLANPMEDLKEV